MHKEQGGTYAFPPPHLESGPERVLQSHHATGRPVPVGPNHQNKHNSGMHSRWKPLPLWGVVATATDILPVYC